MNILITSVGRRSYLVNYFKKELTTGQVHVSNSTDLTPAFKVADKSVVTPLIYDENYIPFLLDYCQKNKIQAIISLFDVDLYILAKNKEKFSKIGVDVIVSNHEFVKICNDKLLTYNYLKENGFLVPKTFTTIKEATSSISKGEISYPVIVKPRWGMGSLSIYKADNEEELKIFYKKIKREIEQSYMKYESSKNMDKSVIFQEMIDGQEYGMDIINNLNGEYQCVIVRKKYAMRSGETDCAEIVENKKISKVGEELGKLTNHIANLDVDIFYCDGKVYILEMNARFGGGYPFSHIAGANLPKAIIKWLRGEKVNLKYLKAKKNTLAHKDIEIVRLK